MMTGLPRGFAEVFHVFGEVPEQLVVFADNLVAGDSGYQ